MRFAFYTLVSCIALQAAASDLPAGTTWGADARTGAMARMFWTDSVNWNLFTVAGHSSVLPGDKGRSMQMRVGTRGLSADNSQAEYSQSEVAALQLRGAIEGKVGYQLDLGWMNQKSAMDGAPSYEAGRMPWGFDVGAAFGPDRMVALGLGMRMRFPSNQTQDTSGSPGVAGDFERWQPDFQSLRVGMATHFAEAVTLAGKFEASGLYDSLEHSGGADRLKSLHRFAVVRCPIISLSAQFDRAELPVQGLADVTFGTTHRMGVMKTIGDATHTGTNIDFPVLVGDSLRILAGLMGRWTRDGHTIRPVIVYERGSLETQAYAPIVGSKDPFAKGEKLPDTGWTTEREGITFGTFYAWDRGLAASLELSTAKRNLEFMKGLGRDNESHTDLGMGIGIEASHRLVPLLNEKVPTSMEFLVRLGWERRSLVGDEIENGFLSGITTGYEESMNINPNRDGWNYGYLGADGPNRGWAGQENAVGLNPMLGGGFDLNLVTFGLGATFLDRALAINTAMQIGSATPDNGALDELDVFGWRAELCWSH